MSYQPVNKVFSSGLMDSMHAFKAMETQRKVASYLAAAMLALPIGVLPWIIWGIIDRYVIGQASFSQGAIPARFPYEFFIAPLVILAALAFIVAMNIRADLVFEHCMKQARKELENGDALLLVLDEQRAAEIESMIQVSILPELLSVSPGSRLQDRINYYAHYQYLFLSPANGITRGRIWMALRQTLAVNLILAFLTSLLCFILLGYFFLPLVLRQLFTRWPAVSAQRLSIAAFMHGNMISAQSAEQNKAPFN